MGSPVPGTTGGCFRAAGSRCCCVGIDLMLSVCKLLHFFIGIFQSVISSNASRATRWYSTRAFTSLIVVCSSMVKGSPLAETMLVKEGDSAWTGHTPVHHASVFAAAGQHRPERLRCCLLHGEIESTHRTRLEQTLRVFAIGLILREIEGPR